MTPSSPQCPPLTALSDSFLIFLSPLHPRLLFFLPSLLVSLGFCAQCPSVLPMISLEVTHFHALGTPCGERPNSSSLPQSDLSLDWLGANSVHSKCRRLYPCYVLPPLPPMCASYENKSLKLGPRNQFHSHASSFLFQPVTKSAGPPLPSAATSLVQDVLPPS